MSNPDRTGQDQAVRDARGAFRPGKSGNPAGRPKGRRNRVSRAALDILDGSAEDLMRKLVELAKEGDPVALKLCIERIVPRRGSHIDVDLRRIERAADIAAAASKAITLAASGEMSLEECRQFLQLLDTHRKTLETADLSVRIEALEVRK